VVLVRPAVGSRAIVPRGLRVVDALRRVELDSHCPRGDVLCFTQFADKHWTLTVDCVALDQVSSLYLHKWSKYRRNAIRSLTFSSFRQVAPICTPIEYIVPYPYTDSASQTASRSVQPFLHSSRQRVPILYNEPPFCPKNCPFA